MQNYNPPKHVCFACTHFRIHGVLIESITTEQAYDSVDNELLQYGLDGVNGRDLIDIIDGYVGGGYAVYTDKDIGKIMHTL